MKKYLSCTVTSNLGLVFDNPLKLSEVHLISQLAKENKKVVVTMIVCSKEQYKQIFG